MNEGQSTRFGIIPILKQLFGREESYLVSVAVFIGVATGLGSVGFTRLIEWVHDICYGTESHGGLYSGRWILLFILPMAGALLVGAITFFFAREAKGHGVPEVMDAIARREGKIRLRVAIAKAISSALTIGTGGSAGTEGPIIQIGAAIGSFSGQILKVSRYNIPVMVGCGAAAGISAIFHAPIAGVLFAMEVFLREINLKSFSPVLIASVISSVTVSAIMGTHEAIFPLLHMSSVHFKWLELGNYVVLGLACAAMGVLFIRVLYATEDLFDQIKIHHILKPVVGASGLGLLGLVMVFWLGDSTTHQPSIYGNGYPVIGHCIDAMTHISHELPMTIGMMLLLVILKMASTCCTLGSGGSGGVFAPSLFIGAVLGYALGLIFQRLEVFINVNPSVYALVGMASVVAATTHAPMAAIVILFEMTRSYQIVMPAMFSATIAVVVARWMCRDSIYTLKLRRRGVHYETIADAAILRRLTVRMVMKMHYITVHENEPLREVINKAIGQELADFIVVDEEGHYKGMVSAEDMREALMQPESIPLLVAADLMRENIPAVIPDDSLDKIMAILTENHVDSLPVINPRNDREFIGMITRSSLMDRYHEILTGH